MGLALDRMGTRYAPAVTLVMLSGSLLLAGWVASTVGVVLYAVWLGLQSGMVRTLGAALLPAWFGTRHLGSIQGTMSFIGVLASAAGPIAFSLTESATDCSAALPRCGPSPRCSPWCSLCRSGRSRPEPQPSRNDDDPPALNA